METAEEILASQLVELETAMAALLDAGPAPRLARRTDSARSTTPQDSEADRRALLRAGSRLLLGSGEALESAEETAARARLPRRDPVRAGYERIRASVCGDGPAAGLPSRD